MSYLSPVMRANFAKQEVYMAVNENARILTYTVGSPMDHNNRDFASSSYEKVAAYTLPSCAVILLKWSQTILHTNGCR
jgi:hypothetical protein